MRRGVGDHVKTKLVLFINTIFSESFKSALRTESAKVGDALQRSKVDGGDERMNKMNDLNAEAWSVWEPFYKVRS